MSTSTGRSARVQRRARIGMRFPTRLDYEVGRAARGRAGSSQPGQEPTTIGRSRSIRCREGARPGSLTEAAVSGHEIAERLVQDGCRSEEAIKEQGTGRVQKPLEQISPPLIAHHAVPRNP